MSTAPECIEEDQGKTFRPTSQSGLFTSLQKDLKRETGVQLPKDRLQDEKLGVEDLHIRTRYSSIQTPFKKLLSEPQRAADYFDSSVIHEHEIDAWMKDQEVVAIQEHGLQIQKRLESTSGFHKAKDHSFLPPIQYAHYLVPCKSCHGGKNPCNDCHGDGRHVCYQCGGRKLMLCHGCSGLKKTTCSSCYGSGTRSEMRSQATTVWNGQSYVTRHDTIYVNVPCGHCSGGHITCSTCHGQGHLQCFTCDTQGKVTCRGCHGEGHITCKICDGSTQLAHVHGIQTVVSVHHDVTSNAKDSLASKVFEQKRFKDIQSGLLDFQQTEFKRDSQSQWSTVCHGRLTVGKLTLKLDGQSMVGDAFHNGKQWVWLPMEKIFDHLFKDLDALISTLKKPWWKVTPWTAKKALNTVLAGRVVHDHWKQKADAKNTDSGWKSRWVQRLAPKPKEQDEASALVVDLGSRKSDWIEASRRGFAMRAKHLQMIWRVLFPAAVAFVIFGMCTVGGMLHGDSQWRLNSLSFVVMAMGLLLFIPGQWLHWHWTLHQATPHDRFERVYARLFRSDLKVRQGWWMTVLLIVGLGFGCSMLGSSLGYKLNPPPAVDWASQYPSTPTPAVVPKKTKKARPHVTKPSEPIRYYGDLPPSDPNHPSGFISPSVNDSN